MGNMKSRIYYKCKNCGEDHYVDSASPLQVRLMYLSTTNELHKCADGKIGVSEAIAVERLERT